MPLDAAEVPRSQAQPVARSRRDLLALVQGALGDRYSVEKEIGRGGAARIFLARDGAGKAVALKVLHPELVVSIAADRFLREIGLLSRVDHPRICRLLDWGERDWLVYYVMDYVEGPTLREYLERVRRAPVEDTLRETCELLEALEYAHGLGVVHRDVKPENVKLSPSGAVLMDFGIAKAVATAAPDRARLTRSGFTLGTSAYMSPEQATGGEIDHRSDLYSVGCVIFECLTGSPPYEHADDRVVFGMHLRAPIPDVRRFRPHVPAELAKLVTKSLAKNPDQRWQSAGEMRAALRTCGGAVRPGG
ncbi:MAG TPA: serine/threonine-protein kinase [Gemmatimonadales bacterium]|nr:serine/threonine-protein kinase [Gemmatimonadales bacterium]